MKKLLLVCSFIATYLPQVHAQNISVAATSSSQCFSGANTVSVSVLTTPAGASHYSWTVTNCSGTSSTLIPVGSGPSYSFTQLCCGPNTIICSAWDYTTSSPAQLGQPAVTHPTVWCPPVFASFATPSLVCAGKTSTLLAGQMSTYTWQPGNITGTIMVVTPTVSTMYTVTATNSLGCTNTNTVLVATNPNPTVTAPPSVNVCAGSTGTLTASGNAMNYIWTGGITNGVPFVVSSPGCYSVTASNVFGCTATAVSCVNVWPVPQQTISFSSNPVCAGQSTSLTCTGGAVSYTWYPTMVTGPSLVAAPMVNTCFTLAASNGSCTSMASSCLVVNSITPVFAAGPSSICLGNSATLTAGGVITYTWNNSQVFPTIIVSPTTATCYTVLGSDGNGCQSSASVCVTVHSLNIAIAASSGSVCLGSSVTYTVSGGQMYSWSGGPSTATMNVIPTANSVYTVVGTDANGCTDTKTTAVTVNTACSDVWPGDANSDGLVDNSDVFELGLAFNNTGTARSPGGNSYVGQYAINWTGTVSTGKNSCHADCDGSGIIDNADTVAIFNNFSLSHSFKSSAKNTGNDITIVPAPVSYLGQWNKADVMLGDATNQLTQVYGVGFDIEFDESIIDDAYLKYIPSFLNNATQNIEFRKTDMGDGSLHAASVRTDGNNVSGNGKIGEFYYKLKPVVPANTIVTFDIKNPSRIGSAGITQTMTSTGGTSNTSNNLVKAAEFFNSDRSFTAYPNPSVDRLHLYAEFQGIVQYHVYDLSGRELLNGTFTSSATIDVSVLAEGNYLLAAECAEGVYYRQLLIQK